MPHSTLTPLLLQTVASVAPGTELRDSLERILRGRTGALIVLGYDDEVEAICTGGFELDVPFSSTRLRELAKMDGGIVLDPKTSRILRAAVQLLPDSSIETSESGTRHRTAERVAKQTGLPVISVSQSMRIIALYVADQRYVLEDSEVILARASQALDTLQRYRDRLRGVAEALSRLEIEDLVTVRDVASVSQRLEMVRRISSEISEYVVELGTDGRLVNLQFVELMEGIAPTLEVVMRYYLPADASEEEALPGLAGLDPTQLIDLTQVARVIGIGGKAGEGLDAPLSPRGYRMLARIPRLPGFVVDALVSHFGGLQPMLSASTADLESVEGVGVGRARAVRQGLSEQAESTLNDRF